MRIIFFAVILFSVLTGSAIYSQTVDSLIKTDTAHFDTSATSSEILGDNSEDDFSPGLLFFVMIGLVFIVVCIGIGIVLTTFGLLIIFGLVSFGILSTSTIVGLHKKSFAQGFKTFMVMSSTICGLILCSIGVWLLNRILHWWSQQTAVCIGVTFGLLTGLTFGLLAYRILQQLTAYFKQKLNLTT